MKYDLTPPPPKQMNVYSTYIKWLIHFFKHFYILKKLFKFHVQYKVSILLQDLAKVKCVFS